jgi:PIN domain nuclease of toxin-antitoxin system
MLLDTMVFVAAMGSLERLSPRAFETIRSAENEVYLSVASAWEMSIKAGLGKLALPDNLETGIEARLRQFDIALLLDIALLPISLSHVVGVRDLPMHHRDPFDRMLVAQARAEGLTLVTNDPLLERYDVPILW